MRTLVTIREPGGEVTPLVIDGNRFADPDAGPIDDEILTGHLYALPGLADCHAHLGSTSMAGMLELSDDEVMANAVRHAWMQLEGGVLLVVDKGSGTDATLTILEAPPTERPELSMAGTMIAPPGGYYAGYGHEVDEDGLIEVVRHVDPRSAWVKIVADWPRKETGPAANYSVEAVTKAVEVAHAAGRRVAVHTMAPAGVRIAVDSGVDSVEHGPFLEAAELATLAARRAAWVPTVTNIEFLLDFLGADSSGGRLMQQALDNLRLLLPAGEALGVTILAGTDLAIPHGGVAREALKLRDYGLSAPAAVAAASSAAYDYLGRDRRFAAGSPANAVFFSHDPRDRLETLLEPQVIIRSGRRIEARSGNEA
jgi:imidazolonepropionase-like amidohydrolase